MDRKQDTRDRIERIMHKRRVPVIQEQLDAVRQTYPLVRKARRKAA